MSASDNESSCPLQPATTATGICTTAPQVFCVASLATLPSTLFMSSPTTVSAPSQPPWAPAAINLQALLQPMIVEAVQRAFHDLPSLAAANAPSSSSAAYTQPSCSLPQAPSSLGESLHFPSFVSTVCLATGMLPSPFMSTLASFSANSMLASPAVATPMSSLSQTLFATGLPAPSAAPSATLTSASYAVFSRWVPRFRRWSRLSPDPTQARRIPPRLFATTSCPGSSS